VRVRVRVQVRVRVRVQVQVRAQASEQEQEQTLRPDRSRPMHRHMPCRRRRCSPPGSRERPGLASAWHQAYGRD